MENYQQERKIQQFATLILDAGKERKSFTIHVPGIFVELDGIVKGRVLMTREKRGVYRLEFETLED